MKPGMAESPAEGKARTTASRVYGAGIIVIQRAGTESPTGDSSTARNRHMAFDSSPPGGVVGGIDFGQMQRVNPYGLLLVVLK